MQTIAAALTARGPNSSSAVQTGTGLAASKTGDQQQAKEKSDFPRLLAQGKQKETGSAASDQPQDAQTKSEDPTPDEAGISALILSLFVPGNFQAAGQGEAEDPLAAAEDATASASLSGETAAETWKAQAGAAAQVPFELPQAAAAESKAAAVLPEAGEKQPGGTGGEQAEQTEQAQQAGGIAGAIVRTLQDMSSGQQGETGSETSLGASAHSEDKKEKATGLAEKNGTVPEFFPGSDSAKSSETTEISQAVEKAIHRFTDDFRGAETSGSEIKLVLEPESLGTLTIAVSQTENGVTAKIRAENKDVCAAISGELPQLIRSMEEKGITVDQVDVSFGGAEQSFSFSQNHQGGGDDRQPVYPGKAIGRVEDAAGTDPTEFWTDVSVGDAAGGTVEYRV